MIVDEAEARASEAVDLRAGRNAEGAVVERNNVRAAYQKVVRNDGGPGYLGYTMTAIAGIRLRFARESQVRLQRRVRELLRQGTGRSLKHTIEVLNPVLRGWASYFRLSESRRPWEELDGWIRRRLRGLIWQQAKTRQRRTEMLRRRGLSVVRAWHSARNGHGSWWNAGASHMNEAFPKAFFDKAGLLSLTDTVHYLQRLA
ncbi:group II intron maturase-specific domain-containing protein [Dyella sp.]|uniref:group II intron maturase-specific domain-containing protein n=1 Tax=Dyella sp. TaxID=1869338 RepID=UPI002FDA9F1C